MLYCSNREDADMEPDHSEVSHEPGPQTPERSEPRAEKAAFTAPFASEGLEQVRGSHC
jgi:hypothetical protein